MSYVQLIVNFKDATSVMDSATSFRSFSEGIHTEKEPRSRRMNFLTYEQST